MRRLDIVVFSQSDRENHLLELNRRCAQPVVFASGVFDLVHSGHLQYLQAARQLGGSLIVGVNSDKSAQKLEKGPSRPFNSAEDRAELIASLRFVDGTVIFDEDTPHELLKALQPAFFVKGGDYSEKRIRKTDLAGLAHVKLKILPLKLQYSSTNLIEKIVSAYLE